MRTRLWRFHLAALTCVAYLIGIGGYALLIPTRSPGRDRASLIDAVVLDVLVLALVIRMAIGGGDRTGRSCS